MDQRRNTHRRLSLSKYNELNPRFELRNWYFYHGMCYGEVHEDQKNEYMNEQNIVFVPGLITDYKDHFMAWWRYDCIKLEYKWKKNK
jgi:hypothetical protein